MSLKKGIPLTLHIIHFMKKVIFLVPRIATLAFTYGHTEKLESMVKMYGLDHIVVLQKLKRTCEILFG